MRVCISSSSMSLFPNVIFIIGKSRNLLFCRMDFFVCLLEQTESCWRLVRCGVRGWLGVRHHSPDHEQVVRALQLHRVRHVLRGREAALHALHRALPIQSEQAVAFLDLVSLNHGLRGLVLAKVVGEVGLGRFALREGVVLGGAEAQERGTHDRHLALLGGFFGRCLPFRRAWSKVDLNEVANTGGVRQLFDRSELLLLVVVDG
mmetsp:Transcript_69626/g.131056  ORF Transcript_69626/g.131056 Transcript_69626/m.131056 type:complete len:204 (+) Transcript_69626:379-990(+)